MRLPSGSADNQEDMRQRTARSVVSAARAASRGVNLEFDAGAKLPLLGALVLYAVLYALLTLAHPFHPDTFLALSDAGGVLPPTVAGIYAFAAAESALGQVRLAWRLISAACLAWAFGELVWMVYEVVLDRPAPFPSLADAGYLGMLPLMALGLILLSSERGRLTRTRPALDGLAIVLTFTAFVWLFVLEPTYADSTASLAEKVIGGLYPIGDLVLLYLLAVAVERQLGLRDSIVLGAMFLGVLLLIAADVGFAYLTLQGEYTPFSVVNVGWPVGFLLLAYGAALSAGWSPSYAEDHSKEAARYWREALPALLIAVMATLSIVALMHEPRSTSIPLLVMTGVAALAVAGRIAISLGALRELRSSRRKLSRWLEFRQRGVDA